MGRHYSIIHFSIEGPTPTDFIIPSSQALHIVLVLQESVNNSVKHANTNNVTITSITEDKAWKIILADKGNGFELDNAKNKIDSYGLANMQQRVKEGGFEYNLETSIGQGTITTLSILN